VKSLRQVLDRAVINDLVTVNPVNRVQKHTLPKQKNRSQPRVLSVEEIDALVAAAINRTPSYAGIIATAAYTGARIREVLGLRWLDIDPTAKLISFRKQIDTGGTKLVPLKTDAAERVNAIIPSLEPFLGREARMKAGWSANHDFVFSATAGKPREYRNVRRATAVAAEQASLGHVRCHDLRHSATSILLSNADLATVSRYVGHHNAATTVRVYTHALGSHEEQAARIAEAAKSAGFGQ
jgi:integrase